MYIVNNSLLTLRFKNINKEPLDKNLVNVKQTQKLFSNKILPLTINEIYYGKLLPFELDSAKQFVSSLNVGAKDFINILKEKYTIAGRATRENKLFIEFKSNIGFYLYTINRLEYIITVNGLTACEASEALKLLRMYIVYPVLML